MKKIIAGFSHIIVIGTLFVLTTSNVFAQSVDPLFPGQKVIDASTPEAVAKLTPEQKAQLEEGFGTGYSDAPVDTGAQCFDYYTFNSVQVLAGPELLQTVSGVPLTLTGRITNDNPYPLLNVQVYAKIFKKSDKRTEENAMKNGYPLVDFVQVADDITLPAKGEIPFKYDYQLPTYMESGDYTVAFFATVANRYNMLGLSFTDDVVGNTTDFSIVLNNIAVPTFDKNSVTLNGKPYAFANFPPSFGKDESVVMEAKLMNPLDTEAAVTISHRLYSWDGLQEDKLRDTFEEVITLAPKETRTISYVAKKDDAVSYLVTAAVYNDARSILNPRFVRSDIDGLRINFPGVMKYPIEANTENTLFSCLHSFNRTLDNGELTLTLTTPEGEPIHSYTYKGSVTGAMMGVADKFTPTQTYSNFDLVATLSRNGAVVESVVIPYRCDSLDTSLCPHVPTPVGETEGVLSPLAIALGVLALILIIGAVWMFGRNKTSLAVILVIMTGGLFASNTFSASACGPVNTGFNLYTYTACHAFTSNFHTQTSTHKSVMTSSIVSSPSRGEGFLYLHLNAIYRATVSLPEGVVSKGASISVGYPRENTDVSWFLSGNDGDSPYGCWSDKVCTGTEIRTNSFYGANVTRPSPVVTGMGSITCSGGVCTASANGAGSVRVYYPINTAYFYNYARVEGGIFGGGYFSDLMILDRVTLPAQTLVFNYNVSTPGNPPTTPTLTCPSSPLTTGTVGTFSFIATDPDNDTLRYQIDWDNNGTVDQNLPGAGYVNSGTSQSGTYTFITPGTYTIKARAQDSGANTSGWGSCTVTVMSPPPPPPIPSISFSASPTSVALGGASTLTWSASNVTSCTASSAWSGSKAVSGSQSTGALTTTPNTYTLTCTGPYGSVSNTVTVIIPAPTLTINANPTVVSYGGSSIITWSSTNATTCTASGDWSGSKAVSGSQTISNIITTPNTYTMTCTGPGGSVTRNANATTGSTSGTSVTIPAPTATLQVRINGGAWTTASQTIESTDTVNLQWGSTNASTCNASGFNTAGATSGIATDVDEPAGGITKTYTVQCPGATGTSPATASVNVTTRSRNPTLTPSSSIVSSGGTATLVYDLNGNASCTFSTSDSTLNNVTVTTNGAKSTGAITQQTAYTLTCTGGSAATIINVEGNIQEQ